MASPIASASAHDPVLPRLDQADFERLRAFHAQHFPGQEVPASHTQRPPAEVNTNTEYDQTEELGYYEDGVRRTLTDDQIRMFRHSEIQRLLLARRQQREKEEEAVKRAQRSKHRPQQQVRHFNEEQPGPNVDTLMYDDVNAPATEPTKSGEKKFLWPELGK
jgi:hypothetical protein